MCRPCLQYSYLLTSQLESQRIYWENKIVHLEKETAEEVFMTLYASGYMSVFLLVSASSTKHLVYFSDKQHEG